MMTLDYTFERRLELQKEAAQRELDEMRKAVEEAVEAARREAEEAKEGQKKAVEAARKEVKETRKAAKKAQKEAHAAGMTEGREDNLWSQIQKKLLKGKTTAQIADELETTEEEIMEIIQKRQ